MGMWESTYQEYCPICEKETEFSSWNDNDDEGDHKNCVECETEFPIPKLSEGDPFFIGDDLYCYHIGNDDEIQLGRFNEK